jgi:hypothetical protein
VDVGSSQCNGLPITLASLDKQRGVQHLIGRFGNLTQVGILVRSGGMKSKKSGITYKINGRPKTEYGPPPRTSNITDSVGKANINHPESCMVRLA